jgi:hypothetical protein
MLNILIISFKMTKIVDETSKRSWPFQKVNQCELCTFLYRLEKRIFKILLYDIWKITINICYFHRKGQLNKFNHTKMKKNHNSK